MNGQHVLCDQGQVVVVLLQLVLVAASLVCLETGQVQIGGVAQVELLLNLVDKQVMDSIPHCGAIAVVDQLEICKCPGSRT